MINIDSPQIILPFHNENNPNCACWVLFLGKLEIFTDDEKFIEPENYVEE